MNKIFFKPDTIYQCIKSESNAYTTGRYYEVYFNAQGHKVLEGDDGLEDRCENLVSQFKEAPGQPQEDPLEEFFKPVYQK